MEKRYLKFSFFGGEKKILKNSSFRIFDVMSEFGSRNSVFK